MSCRRRFEFDSEPTCESVNFSLDKQISGLLLNLKSEHFVENMLERKRKMIEGDSVSSKKNKGQIANNNKEGSQQKNKVLKNKNVNKLNGNRSKKFKIDDDKSGKKFNKEYVKGKPQSFRDKSKQDSGEKPKWSEMKKEKKNLRIVRRKAKATAEIFEISHKAKLLSAQIQRKVVKQEFRVNACKELHCLLKGQYKSIALTHDLSRVIQVLLKNCSEDIKNEISEELIDIVVQMMQSKYAQHAVKRILKYGTDFIRHEVIKKLFGHIVSLAAHTISAPVLDYAYGEFATKKEKLHMQQEFYGDIYKNTKDDKVITLRDAYKDSPEMKVAILQACKANIQRILDKNLHDGELLHSVLYDYMWECSAEDRAELIGTLSPLIVPLSNSLPGVNVACLCVWQGTNKDKKAILKVVKEHVVPLCKHKTGYRLLLAIFDSVDDTVLVKKAIVTTIASNLKDIANDHWGNMVLHWLVKPKDPAAFHPSFVKYFEEGCKSGTSKKDADLRVSELREAIFPAVKKDIEEDPDFWLSNKTAMLLTVAVLSMESSKAILYAIAKSICRVNWVVMQDDKEILAVEDAGLHMCLKKLASLDKDADGDDTLGNAISDIVDKETVKMWIASNRGCFFLLKLIESNKEEIASKIVKKIKIHASVLKQQNSQGAKLLLQMVQKK